MGLDLSKINAGVSEFGQIVQQGVSIFDQIAQRVTRPPTPQPTPTPAPPEVTTPAPTPAGGSSVPWLPLLVLAVVVLLAQRRS